MASNKSISGVATKGDVAAKLNDPNTESKTVPSGEIWYVEDVIVDGDEEIRASIFVDSDNLTSRTLKKRYSNTETGNSANDVETDSNNAYYVNSNNNAVAVDKDVGSTVWTKSLSSIGTGVTTDGTEVFISLDNGDLVSVDATDGATNYTITSIANTLTAIEYYNNDIYVSDSTDTIYAYDLSQNQQWTATIQGRAEDMNADSSGLYCASPSGNGVDALNLDGSSKWSSGTDGNGNANTSSLTDDYVITGTNNNNGDGIIAYNKANGDIVWKNSTGATDFGDIYDGIYYGDNGSSLIKIDTTDGTKIGELDITANDTNVHGDDGLYIGYDLGLIKYQELVLGSGPRSGNATQRVNLDTYAYSGDEIFVGVNKPSGDVGFRLEARAVIE